MPQLRSRNTRSYIKACYKSLNTNVRDERSTSYTSAFPLQCVSLPRQNPCWPMPQFIMMVKGLCCLSGNNTRLNGCVCVCVCCISSYIMQNFFTSLHSHILPALSYHFKARHNFPMNFNTKLQGKIV